MINYGYLVVFIECGPYELYNVIWELYDYDTSNSFGVIFIYLIDD